jgi:predicted TIM-barrel fold metal-dependent hydrolase
MASNGARMHHPHRIDTHHHILPPFYVEKERQRILAVAADFGPRLMAWEPSKAVDALDRGGVAAAITSMSAPGIWFGDRDATKRLARECNDFGADMSGRYRGRFGLFATLPLPGIDGSLQEIEYAFDVLKADGIGLMTNYGDQYPGDATFAPVFDELERRRAVVYFHPTTTDCCTRHGIDIPEAIMEYPFDTTRAIVSLLFSGTLSRCPNVRFIFSHAGGTLPMLAHRIARWAAIDKNIESRLPHGAMAELQKLFYDVVSATNPITLAAIRELAGISQLLFGSDYPYWDPSMTAEGLGKLGLSPDDLHAIERGNALRLFPRLESSDSKI